MDRFQAFHQIITKSNLASRHDLITKLMSFFVNELRSDRAMFFAGSAGSFRCESARGPHGVGMESTVKQVPNELINKCFNTGAVVLDRIPIAPADVKATTSSWGRIQIKHIVVIPAVAGTRNNKPATTAVLYLERPIKFPAYQEEEISFVRDLLRDISHLIHNTQMFEDQSHEIQQLKKEMVRSKIGMVSEHPSMLKLFHKIRKLAHVPSTVLIRGESGTGKELVARAIYNLSGLEGPFISVNCGGIEPNLMKSELFGHKKGSFTGAQADRDGYFKRAEGGILFLDELAEMPMDIQVLLLRTLQQGEIQPVGSDVQEVVHTRVVAATHRDLREMVEKGEFRNDLYQRLKGISLFVPPLRERQSDIAALMEFFMRKYNDKLGTDFRSFSDQAKERLCTYHYCQGNVRELEHIIERAMVFEEDPHVLSADNLDFESEPGQSGQDESGLFEERMDAYGRNLLQEAIEACHSNKTKAMKKLGLPRTTFYALMNKYKLS